MMKFKICASFFLCQLLLSGVSAQSLPVSVNVLDEAYRREQLLGNVDSSVSFALRPLFNSYQKLTTDSVFTDTRLRPRYPASAVALRLLPLSWLQQYNSHHPYGWNDGSMIPARGYQTTLTGGFFAKLGPLSIQVMPEFVYAQNKSFETFGINNTGPGTDIPERFGTSAFSKVFWGQSSIRLTAGPVSFGISNENLWWGPGIRNSLLMSNNTRGFKHLTLNTIRPVHTPIGSIEAQIIAGRLEGSGYSPIEADTTYHDWRYLNGLAFAWQPKWVPGLFLGLNRSFQMYRHNMGTEFGDYVPIFMPFQKNKTNEGSKLRDQLTSLYARWLFSKARAEVYFEYGLNDHSYNLRDFVLSPEHSRAYIVGLRKLIPIKNKSDEYIQVHIELTQLQQTIDRILRNAGAWYYHGQILHGYTHHGEVLGAGIGPGSNLQSLDLSWIKGLKLVGLQIDRYSHNNEYFNIALDDPNGKRRNWIDISAAARATWNYKNMLLNAKLQFINSMNYQWQLKNYNPNAYYIPENDVFNFQAQLGITYLF